MQQISKRLAAVADYVTEGNRLVDVGTDHAYLPIYLLEEGRIPSALAADVRKGPLERAKENIAAHGLSNRIETLLSDGLKKINTDYESLVLAGMGGRLIRDILAADLKKSASFREIILEPQSDLQALRAFLREKGFRIDRENMVLEEGKYYPILHVVREKSASVDPARKEKLTGEKKTGKKESGEKEPGEKESGEEEEQLLYDRYGYHLIKEAHPVLLSYLEKEEKEKEKVLRHLETLSEKGQSLDKRRQELEEDLYLNRRAQEMIKKSKGSKTEFA